MLKMIKVMHGLDWYMHHTWNAFTRDPRTHNLPEFTLFIPQDCSDSLLSEYCDMDVSGLFKIGVRGKRYTGEPRLNGTTVVLYNDEPITATFVGDIADFRQTALPSIFAAAAIQKTATPIITKYDQWRGESTRDQHGVDWFTLKWPYTHLTLNISQPIKAKNSEGADILAYAITGGKATLVHGEVPKFA